MRYKEAFGCEWDLTPWGARWPDVLAEARAADRQYAEGMEVLRDLQRVLHRVLDHAHRCGIDPKIKLPFDVMVGHTMADVGVADVVMNGGDALLALLKRVDEAITLLDLPPAQYVQHIRTIPDNPIDPLIEVLTSTPVDPIRWDAMRRLTANATRQLREVQFRSVSGSESVSIVGPGLIGAPPRSIEGASWRRAYLVELLDSYPLRPAVAPEGMVAPTDGDIALVSLLSGALEEMFESREKSVGGHGVAAVLAAERKAIALARRRRGPSSKFLHEHGMTVQDVFRLRGWTEESGKKVAAGRRTRGEVKGTKVKRKQ
ncbi:hypothetical protein [Polyangium fumosum]|uniref:Uncharacterized protein n=1 Tax=Polyangium fumosum TaxID=889272 RepID=A0A4U1IUP1_9BACT|nr:hypothetical protein [Polyangium fumosum]TKC98148.1 hypothetical protein E8A74_42225 [Polyangium fumosum]